MTEKEWKPKTDFTEEEAAPYIGKHVLAGMTYKTVDDRVDRLEQFHGTIVKIDRKGIVIKLHGKDEEKILPPDLSRLEEARPGTYTLEGSGEVVENPDFTTMWIVYPPGYKGQ